MRKDNAFCEDAPDLIKHLIALLLNFWTALGHAAIDKAHADGANFVDQRFRDRVQYKLDRVYLEF